MLADGQAALRAEDNAGARAALDELRQLQRKLDLEYTIQIVNRPDQQSGVWRIPDVNTRARNYYLVVEAVAGFVTNSLALLSDAGHMLTDATGV